MQWGKSIFGLKVRGFSQAMGINSKVFLCVTSIRMGRICGSLHENNLCTFFDGVLASRFLDTIEFRRVLSQLLRNDKTKRVHRTLFTVYAWLASTPRRRTCTTHSPGDPADPAAAACPAAAASGWDRTARDPAGPSCADPADPAARASRPSAPAPRASHAVPAATADPCPSGSEPFGPRHCERYLWKEVSGIGLVLFKRNQQQIIKKTGIQQESFSITISRILQKRVYKLKLRVL